jgi:hypothetical protein
MSAELMGMMEHYARMTAHRGANSGKAWGGIPIVILVGDDYQLPSVDPGAFYANATVSECNPGGTLVMLLTCLTVLCR